ncbi:hypothetical protein BDV18DRAFT_161324 [Aspergillus unguis]
MLERVHQHLQSTTSSTQEFDLRRLWNWLELGLEDRNNDLVDWGFGDAFDGDDRLWPGMRFDPGYQEWYPVKGSMWTVLDPEGPFDCQHLLDLASTSAQPWYSFTFPVSVKPKPNANANILSSLPRELQFSILELLPTPSVLKLFLASPDFRQCAEHPPSSFWKSRLFFDMPWCADIILSHIQVAQSNGTEKEKNKVPFDRLLRFLHEFYKSPGQEPDGDNLEFKGLRNRRRIWLNCERIIREMEMQQDDGRVAGHGMKGEGEGSKPGTGAED